MIAIADIESWLTNTSKGLVRSARPGQLTMAKLCAQLMNDGGIGFIEAGTGTGKSIAYSLPAMYHDRRVVISTGKKTLQEQLVNKDLPAIRAALGQRPFSLMKGVQNYFCQLRMDEFMDTEVYQQIPEVERRKFLTVIETSPTGDIGGYQAGWTHATRVTDCVRALCPHIDTCKYVAGRNNALLTPVVVVNHSLLAQDLALGGGKIFGEYDVLVIDEGHNAPKAFREAFACTLHPRQPEYFDRWFQGTDFNFDGKLKEAYGQVFRNTQGRSGVLEVSPAMAKGFGAILALVTRSLETLNNTGMSDENASEGDRSYLARQRAKYAGATRLLAKIKKVCEIVLDVPREGFDAGPYCASFTADKKEDPQITVTPIEIGPLVAPALLKARALIVTSATLTTGGNFGYVADEFGFSSSQLTVQQIVPSPFQYAQQSVLYVSSTAPDPTKERGATYYEQMADEVHELLNASGGGALVLCASREDMEKLYNRLWEAYGGNMSYKLGMQGKDDPERLTAWFKTNPDAVLVALKTFWEGVDIPGLGLRLVVIPRIPFPNKGDVLLQARKAVYIQRKVEMGEDMERSSMDAWSKFDLNEALLDLAQGGGRLIRTETDLGVVALLDRRAQGKMKQYSGRIRKAFPHPLCETKPQVLNFLAALKKAALP